MAERDANSGANSAPAGPFFSTQEQWEACHRRHSNPQTERENTMYMRHRQMLPPPQPPQPQRSSRGPSGFDLSRLQSLVPPEMRASHGAINIDSSQSEASTLTSSQSQSQESRRLSQDNIALLQQPSQEEENEFETPASPTKGPCQLKYEESNCKKTLMSMLIGLTSEDGRTLGDAFQEPYFGMKQRVQHVINNEHLKKEILRRAEVADINPKPKPG